MDIVAMFSGRWVLYAGFFLFQAEDGIRYLVRSRGLGDVYKRQMCFNPLYTGHQRCCRVIKYGLLGQVSIPYTRITNEDSAVKAVIKKSVSIPYTRVTNMDYEKAMII